MTRTTLLLASAALALAGCNRTGDDTSGGNTAGGGTAGGNAAQTTPAPAGGDWTTTIVETPEGGMRMGNPDAPVKLVEFASLTCHVCRDFSKESTPSLEENYVKSGKVSYEYRNIVRDPLDLAASVLARCGGPAPFFKLTEQLFAEQDALVGRAGKISPADVKSMEGLTPGQEMLRLSQLTELDRFVGMRGIPAAKANACLANEGQVNRLVQGTAAASKQYNIPGTPTFVINGKEVENVSAWKLLEPKIKEALGG